MSTTITAAIPHSTVVTGVPSQSQLEYLASQAAPCLLRPMAFFVSWHGVLTLAYSGFPPSLARLKRHLADTLTALPPEYSGSKWPKTSLGALHDAARLTPQQLETLNTICREESSKLSQEGDGQAVYVDQLKVVFYECRSLERRLLEHPLRLLRYTPLDEALPDAEEQQRVRGVVAEAESPGYWFLASKDGSRESHYRNTYLGVTLVADLANTATAAPRDFGSHLQELLAAFRVRVDSELPGLYRWFQQPSLHVTVRSLMG